MYAAWATKKNPNPPWYPEFRASKPIHQAMFDHSLRAIESVTKVAVNPGVSAATFCRFNNEDVSPDRSPVDKNRSPSRTPQPSRPSSYPLPPPFPTEDLQLLGHYPDPKVPNCTPGVKLKSHVSLSQGTQLHRPIFGRGHPNRTIITKKTPLQSTKKSYNKSPISATNSTTPIAKWLPNSCS